MDLDSTRRLNNQIDSTQGKVDGEVQRDRLNQTTMDDDNHRQCTSQQTMKQTRASAQHGLQKQLQTDHKP